MAGGFGRDPEFAKVMIHKYTTLSRGPQQIVVDNRATYYRLWLRGRWCSVIWTRRLG